jgi:hypothetical protein
MGRCGCENGAIAADFPNRNPDPTLNRKWADANMKRLRLGLGVGL